MEQIRISSWKIHLNVDLNPVVGNKVVQNMWRVQFTIYNSKDQSLGRAKAHSGWGS